MPYCRVSTPLKTDRSFLFFPGRSSRCGLCTLSFHRTKIPTVVPRSSLQLRSRVTVLIEFPLHSHRISKTLRYLLATSAENCRDTNINPPIEREAPASFLPMSPIIVILALLILFYGTRAIMRTVFSALDNVPGPPTKSIITGLGNILLL